MKYFKKVFLFSILLYVSFYVFNISVDPYDKFNINYWNLKTKAVSSYRDNKFYQIDATQKKYDLFIIGSSRVQRFDPEYIESITGLKTFNYGVNNSKPEDLLAITRHIIDKQKPKYIFLQMDFYNLNENIPTDKRLENSPLKDYLSSTFSKDNEKLFFYYEKSYTTFESIKDSVKVIFKNYIGNPEITHKNNGMFVRKELSEDIKLAEAYFKNEYKEYTFSQNRVLYFKEIRKLCKDNNIELIVSISPINEEHYNKIKDIPSLFARLIEFKQYAVDIFGKVYDFNNPCAFKYQYPYWNDSVHPSEELSKEMTDIIFKHDINKCGFGKIIQKSNIKQYIDSL